MAAIRERLRSGTALELWWQGAHGSEERHHAAQGPRRGTRPAAPRTSASGRPTSSAPSVRGKARPPPWSCSRCNTAAMNVDLTEFLKGAALGAHAIVLLDQASWHTTRGLNIPGNITLLPLPPRCPELNPVESVWQFLRGNWLSNRIFSSYQDILDHCCYAWNRLVDQPWRIFSIGLRDWTHRF